MAAEILQFVCLADNFGVLVHDPKTGAVAAVDAPDGGRIVAAAKSSGWVISDILITHHHADHVQGVERVKADFPNARVVGPRAEADRIPMIDRRVTEGDIVEVGALKAQVIATPGHTAGHVVYHFAEEGVLFAGDTLFAMGCGRVFETPMETMWASLGKLKRLPPQTRVYCGHEYTHSNARFAVSVDPDNAAARARLAQVESLRAEGASTLPTTLAQEFDTNPFLRADDPAFKASLGMVGASDAAVFAALRERKNRS